MLETVTWQAGGRHLEWQEETGVTGDEINAYRFHASRGQILKMTLELTKRELPEENIKLNEMKTKMINNKVA